MNTFSTGVKQIPTQGATEAFAQLRETNRPKSTFEIIERSITNRSPMVASPMTDFEKLINIPEGEKVKRLTVKLSETEYEKLQALYDFTEGKFSSLDDMLRQMLLQPELWFRFLSFLGYDGNPPIDFIARNKVDGINWC